MTHKTKKLVLTALFMALTCVATMSIRIPTPATSGYIHPGDAIVILSGIFLGPSAAFLAAGLGSAMADVLGGYFVYVPITFIVKGLVAFCSYYTFHFLSRKAHNAYLAVIACGVVTIVLVVGGYFVCEIPLYGVGAALASVPSNTVQGISGLVISSLLFPLLNAVPDMKRMMNGQQ